MPQKPSYYKAIAVSAWIVITLGNSLLAAEENYSKRIKGDQIASSAAINVVDGKYPQMVNNSSWNTIFRNKKVKNVISLSFDLDRTEYVSAFSVTVDFTLDLTDENFVVDNESGTLTIDYDPNVGVIYKSDDIVVFEDGHVANLTITNVSLSGLSEMPEGVSLENEIQVTRYYRLKVDKAPNVTKSVADQELKLAWNKMEGATHYEVQWTFVDNYDGAGGSISAANLSYDFRWDASQLITKENLIKIPILYDEGYIVFRVRAVGRYLPNTDALDYGAWTQADYGTISTAVGGTHNISAALTNDNVNWSSTVAYGENGQSAMQVTYLDGTLRERQNLSKDAEREEAVLTETYYDYHGRPAVHTLAAPTGDGTMEYYDFFNRDLSGTNVFSKYEFDRDDPQDNCLIEISGMSKTFGTALYYSLYNTVDDGQQGYVAQADHFPYTQIEYTPDKTGRVQRVTIPGEHHHLESGREQVMEYSTPSQVLLNHLFGTDVGSKENYVRVTTLDANGQTSARYMDGNGRVIATSVIGEPPPNLLSLDNETNASATGVIQESLTPDATTNGGYEIISVVAVDVAGSYDFTYNITPETFSIECMENICFDCHYDLNIEIKDGCGIIAFDEDYVIGPQLADDLCATPIAEFEALIDDLYLDKGHYIVTKTLSPNLQYMDDYIDLYVNNTECIKSYEEVLSDELAEDFDLNCNWSPCEEECLNQLGSEEDFITGGGTAQEYYDLRIACLLECERTDPCEDFLLALEADVMPGGQYALFFDQTNNSIDPTIFPLSVLNMSNQLGTNENWRNPTTPYLDANGNVDYITLANGTQVLPEHSSVSVEVFINNYISNPSWAKSLVEYHPEYCFYESCKDNNTSGSNQWDYYFKLTQKFNEANQQGYFNPLNVGTTQGLPQSIGSNSSNQDPFFQSNPGQVHYADMVQRMMDYFTINGNTYTIWEMAIVNTYCPEAQTSGDIDNCLLNSPTFGSPGCSEDILWHVYKDLYQALKHEFVRLVAIEYSIENYCYNGCIGSREFDYDPMDYDFKISPHYTTSQPCHGATEALYANKVQRYGINFSELEPETTLEEDCEELCYEKATHWVELLDGCSLGLNEQTIINELVELCTLGCDIDNLGGSSTLPSGTQTTNGNTSIDEVLAYHLGSTYKSELCSPWLIGDPMPYGHDEAVAQAKLDECSCDKLLQNEYDFQNLASSIPGVMDGSDYFLHQYGIPLPLYDQLVCDCDNVYFDEYSTAWTPSSSWNASAIAALEALDRDIGLNLGCNTCLSCDQLGDIVDDVTSIHGFSSNFDYFNLILTNYLNSTNLTNFSVEEILTTLNRCDIASGAGGTWCSEAYEEMDELEWMLNELVEREKLFNTSATTYNLNSVPGFYDSYLHPYTIGHFFWPNSATTTASLSGEFNIGISYDETEIPECQVGLEIVGSSLPAYVTLGNIVAFDNIAPATSVNGMNRNFIVDATFEDPFSTASTTISINGWSSCFPIKTCYIEAELSMCTPEIEKKGDNLPIPACLEQQIRDAEFNAMEYYEYLKGMEVPYFQQQYEAQCSLAIESEEFVRENQLYEYHFTLYYYDLVGNLVKTVPPSGIDHTTILMNTAHSGNVDAARNAGTTLIPSHTMVTKSRYNSRNQMLQTTSPDGGLVKYWYDNAGNLIYSQNAVQAAQSPPQYSFTLLDEHSRVVETGQVGTSLGPHFFSDDRCDVEDFIASGTKSELTRVFYGDEISWATSSNFPDGQHNLSNRIATIATYYYDNQNLSYDNAYHYSYDEHGNVVAVIFENTELQDYHQQSKLTTYEYDLHSGKLTSVEYQGNTFVLHPYPTMYRHPDAFYTRFFYDKNNRLVSVETSEDKLKWHQDAKYYYYDHGPLARVEIGNDKVHGQDFYYTIHGWLKGINSNTLHSDRDPGNDGALGYLENFNKIHKSVAEDAYGISLSYYNSDYKEIQPLLAESQPEALISGSGFASGSPALFNGNIRSKVTAIQGMEILGTAYQYDQIDRLKSMTAFNNLDVEENEWTATAAMPDYAETYTFDPNGNFVSLERNGFGSELDMDDLSYNLISGTNKLDYVSDAATDYASYTDIKTGQSSGNYTYDAMGRLVSDAQSDITDIQWTLDGKVKKVTLGTSTPTYISFEYDAFGNRIKKLMEPAGSSDEYTTYYVHDARGVLMSIYEYELLVDADLGNYALTAKQAQVPMYGLSRIGTYDRYKTIYEKTYISGQTTKTHYRDEITQGEFVTGKKQFELTDHLGNVLATVSDNKLVKEGELIVLDVFESGISTEGWTAFPSGAWVYTDDPNDRLVIDPPNQYEGAVNTINTVSGQTYWVHIDLNIGGGTSVGMSAYENGTATLLGSADVSSGGVVGFYFTANSTSTDIKVFSNDATPSTFYLNSVEIVETSFMADVHMKSDYYPYGMPMPGRSFSIEGYRFGLNGMEKDNEIKGYGNSYTTFFRQYDPRLGRWFSTDPVVKPWESPYASFANNPIVFADPHGDDPISWIATAFENIGRAIGNAYRRLTKPSGRSNRIKHMKKMPTFWEMPTFARAKPTSLSKFDFKTLPSIAAPIIRQDQIADVVMPEIAMNAILNPPKVDPVQYILRKSESEFVGDITLDLKAGDKFGVSYSVNEGLGGSLDTPLPNTMVSVDSKGLNLELESSGFAVPYFSYEESIETLVTYAKVQGGSTFHEFTYIRTTKDVQIGAAIGRETTITMNGIIIRKDVQSGVSASYGKTIFRVGEFKVGGGASVSILGDSKSN